MAPCSSPVKAPVNVVKQTRYAGQAFGKERAQRGSRCGKFRMRLICFRQPREIGKPVHIQFLANAHGMGRLDAVADGAKKR